MSRARRDFGEWGEEQACCFLQRHGFYIVERNYYTTFGEIDIIARKGDDYYFIEVKSRHDRELANDDSITYFKKQRLAKAVRAYCYIRNVTDKSIILAGLILEVNRLNKKVFFRFCVMC